jgi:hypothetical protein
VNICPLSILPAPRPRRTRVLALAGRSGSRDLIAVQMADPEPVVGGSLRFRWAAPREPINGPVYRGEVRYADPKRIMLPRSPDIRISRSCNSPSPFDRRFLERPRESPARSRLRSLLCLQQARQVLNHRAGDEIDVAGQPRGVDSGRTMNRCNTGVSPG